MTGRSGKKQKEEGQGHRTIEVNVAVAPTDRSQISTFLQGVHCLFLV